MIKFEFKKENKEEKITANKMLEKINNYSILTKTQQTDALNILKNIFDVDNKNNDFKVVLNSEKRKEFNEAFKKLLNYDFFDIIKGLSNNDFKNVLLKAINNDYKIVLKATTKTDYLTAFATTEKTTTLKNMIKSIILATMQVLKLNLLNYKEQIIICTFDEWQALQQKAYEEYNKTLLTFFNEGNATNEQPTKKDFEIKEVA